jgi:hypothetical protein
VLIMAVLSRTGASDHHTRALAITRDISAPLEEARALEGIGQCHIQTTTSATAPPTYAMHWRSTSASEPHARRLQEILAQPGQLTNQPDHGPSRPSHHPLHCL